MNQAMKILLKKEQNLYFIASEDGELYLNILWISKIFSIKPTSTYTSALALQPIHF